MAVALLVAACSSSGTPGGSDGGSNGGGSGSSQGGGDGNGGGDGGTNPSARPNISPSIPAPGHSTEIEFQGQAHHTTETGQRSEPLLLLARGLGEGDRAAGRSPTTDAADAIRAWNDYQHRALIAIFGGPQPDSGYAVHVTHVDIIKGGNELAVFARLIRLSPGAQGVWVPWQVVSVAAASVVLAKRCTVTFLGQTSISAPCQ